LAAQQRQRELEQQRLKEQQEAEAKALKEAQDKKAAEAKALKEAQERRAEEIRRQTSALGGTGTGSGGAGSGGTGGSGTSGSGTGAGAGGTGNPFGNQDGSGTGGSGGGTGGSSGVSRSDSLKGRTLVGNLAAPAYNSNEEGKVVVRIVVKKDGSVSQAGLTLGGGTTTSDSALIKAAIEAAKKVRFNATDSDEDQIGEITYIFKLR
jgi:TonB family protein